MSEILILDLRFKIFKQKQNLAENDGSSQDFH